MTEAPITRDGTIAEVMETWPLQLELDVGDGTKRLVRLHDQTRVVRGGEEVAPSELRPGVSVRVEGTETPRRIRADRIEIRAISPS